MKVVGVIPARYASTRLPAKPLADLLGKPMVQHVVERARAASTVDRVIVATDDERIASVVRGFGGDVMMTSPDIRSGSDRVAAIARMVEGDIFVNIQGDEPLIAPAMIDAAVRVVGDDPTVQMGTLIRPLDDVADVLNPSIVKVAVAGNGDALYFSRSTIPHVRDEILHRIEAAAAYNGSRVSVIEIGGTIGDFQNALFIEAARVLKMKYPDDVLFVMVSYLPTPGTLGEMKTKPTQMAVRDLNSYGVQPDFLVARSKEPIDEKRKEMRDSIAAQRVKTAQFYAKRRDFDAARIYYQLVTEKFGDTGSAEKAQKWLAANPAPESTAADKALRSTQKPS